MVGSWGRRESRGMLGEMVGCSLYWRISNNEASMPRLQLPHEPIIKSRVTRGTVTGCIVNNQHYMKRLAIVVITAGVILTGGITFFKPSTVEYVNPEPEVIEKEVQVDALDKAIKDAQDAKQDAIKATAQSAYDEAYNQEMKKVELEVIKTFGEKLDARQIELEKETKQY